MRGAGLRLGIRRAGLHPTRFRAGPLAFIPCAVGARRRGSTAGDAWAAPPAPAAAMEPPGAKDSLPGGSSAAALFETEFRDMATNLDVAPIRRPHMVGSLVCSVDDHPVSITLVEDCDGTATEAVTEAVQWCAVRCAFAIRRATHMSVRTFFLRHVCAARPRTMERLDSLDLVLRLRLMLCSGNDVATDDAEAASPAVWRCTAALLDPWRSHPQFIPVACPSAAAGEAECGEAVGELLSVVGRVMDAVDAELQRCLAQHTTDLAQEARLFLSEVGDDLGDANLIAHCLRGAPGNRALVLHRSKQALRALWGEVRQQPTWLLDSAALMSADDTDHPLALRLSLRRVVHLRRRTEAGTLSSTTVTLQSTRIHRGLRELLDIGTDARSWRLFDNSLHASSTPCTQPLKAYHLAQRLSENEVSWEEQGAPGPLDLIDHLLRAVAIVSPTIAYDWVGAARCGEVGINAAAVADRCRPSVGPGLPTCVRWTTLMGRRPLNEFAAHARDGDGSEGNANRELNAGPALPPVWPLLHCVRAGACAPWRVHALRELLQLECGLRLLPRVHIAIPSSPPLSLQYDVALSVTTGAPYSPAAVRTAAHDGFGVEVYHVSRYADVVTAALAQTPWAATPFLNSLALPRGGASDAPPMWTLYMPIEVPALTQGLRRMGLTAALSATHGVRLDYTLPSGKRGPSFRDVNGVAGYTRLIRYGAKCGRYVTAHVPLGATPVAVLQTLLAAMAEDGATAGIGSAGVGRRGKEVHLPLPLAGSATKLETVTEGEREAAVHALLSVIDACCRKPAELALVVPPLMEAADMVFPRYWPVVAPLLASQGAPLQARLRPTRTGEGASGGGRSIEHELVIATEASAPVSVRLDGAAGCMSAVYSAVRTALWRSRPELFSTCGAAADTEAVAALPFIRLATLADFAEALLFSSVVDCEHKWDLLGLTQNLFSENVFPREADSTTEMWLQLAADTPPLRLHSLPPPDGKVANTQLRLYDNAVTRAVLQQCAAATPLYWTVFELTKQLRAAARKNRTDGLAQRMHVRLSCEWGPAPLSTAAAAPTSAPQSWRLHFVAELCRGGASAMHEARNPHVARIGAAWSELEKAPSTFVLQREAGPDGFAVVWRLLHGPVLGGPKNEGLPMGSAAYTRDLRCVPSGFVPATLRTVARLHDVAEVGLQYNLETQQLVLEGWRAPRCDAGAPAREAAITIASVATSLRDLLARLFLLPRRLLEGDTERVLPTAPAVLPLVDFSFFSKDDLVVWLCAVLDASPTDFEYFELHESHRVWRGCVAVPLRLLHLTVATSERHRPSASPAGASSSFLYIYASHSTRRNAVRGALHYLVLNVLFPHTSPSIEGVSVTVSFEPQRWSLPGLSTSPAPRDGSLPALQTPAAATPQPKSVARPRKTSRVRRSVVDRIHEHVEGAMSGLVDCCGGRVALGLSHTFGLNLVYTGRSEAAAAVSAPGTTPPQPTVVQLVREAWLPDVWAPQQVLAAELRVVQRIFAQEQTTADAHDFVTGLLLPEAAAKLAPLECGPHVRAKEFCVSFFYRYFGWRVCEQADVAGLSRTRGHSDVVVMQCEALTRRARRDVPVRDGALQPPGRAGTLVAGEVAATLQLAQIRHAGGTAKARLVRVVADSRAASLGAALEALWGPCMEHIQAAFDVSPGLSSEEVDRRMARFMHACLDMPPAQP